MMGGKNYKKIMYILTPLILLILALIFSIKDIPDTIFIRMKEDVKSNYVFQIYEKENIPTALVDSGKKVKNEYKMNVKFLGLFPVKSVNVKRVPDISLYPGGTSIGVKLSTKGVLVVALSDIEVDGKRYQVLRHKVVLW